MFLRLGDERGKREAERTSYTKRDVQARVTLASLDEADVRVVNVGPLSESLLRKPLRPSVPLNHRTESARHVSVGHRVCKMAEGPLVGH